MFPLRSSQACAWLIGSTIVISGHCQGFVSGSGAETLSEILNSIASIKLKAAHWNRLSHDAMARIFVKIFKALQDEDIHYIEISGCTGLVWITLSLFWLNRDKVALFHEGNCILGQANSKIRVLFRHGDQSTETESESIGEKQGGWDCKTWKSGQSVPQLVGVRDKSAIATRFDSLTMIPARSTRNYYLAIFESHEVVEALGAAAMSFVRAALQVDNILCKRSYFRQPFSSLVSKRPLENNASDESSMLKYLGWATNFSAPCSLANAIHNGFLDCILG